LLEAMGQRARAHVEERFTWTACLEGWRRAFEDVLALSPRCGRSLPPLPGTGRGRLGWAPAALRDVVRRARRRVFGVPPGMVGGEEWPWVSSHHDPDLLASIESVARALDLAEEP